MLMRSLVLGFIATAALPLFAAAAPADVDSYRPQDAVAAATSLVSPSVVAVETRFKEPTLSDEYVYWQYFRGARPLYGLYGTGFIYKDSNYVLTTDFILSNAEFIRVILPDGRSFRAEKIGSNKDLDVAVLKVDWGPNLLPVSPSFGNSDQIKLGQPMAIVGKALNSVDTFATAGIVSAIRKQMPGQSEPTDEFLQFDAPFDLSYIGAPMVDVFGNVIGMVKGTSSSGTNLNLGIPINEAVYIADRIISGDLTEIWLGVETQLMTDGLKVSGFAPRQFDWNNDGTAEDLDFGIWVSYVEPNSPAEIGGLLPGDIICQLDSRVIKYQYDWDSFMRSLSVGQLVYIGFIRKNPLTGEWKSQTAQVQILANPESSSTTKSKPGAKPAGRSTYHRSNMGSRSQTAPRSR
jgi:S1-C subfamily serine protease